MRKHQCLLFVLKQSFICHKKKFCAIAFSNPTFSLAILVQTFLLINNHMENWVRKSTEIKFFNFKVLESYSVENHL